MSMLREQKSKTPAGQVGLLSTVDAVRVFGMTTNIRYKLFLVTTEAVLEDAASPVLVSVANDLSFALCNPFFGEGVDLSGQFGQRTFSTLSTFNTNLGMSQVS